MPLHFSSLLTSTKIHEIAERYHYSRHEYVEKFIMDFEMQYQIRQKLLCIVRGGMCMPFYTDDHNANRLSIDIDLLTSKTTKDVDIIMKELNSELVEVDIEQHHPKGKGYPIENLISYKIYYNSIFGNRDWIKVDYLCEVNVPVFTREIPANYELFAFSVDYDMNILSRGSLIADKLSTLSLETIGLPDRKFGEIPKQIFDIGSQLRNATKQDILETIETFEKFTDFKLNISKSTYTIDDVLESIDNSLKDFFKFDRTAVLLSRDEENRFSNFLGTYMGRPYTYKKTGHLGDILLILLLVKIVKEILAGSIQKDSAAAKFIQTVEQLKEFHAMDGSEIKRKTFELLSQSMPEELHPYQKMLRGQPIEYTYLLQQIYA